MLTWEEQEAQHQAELAAARQSLSDAKEDLVQQRVELDRQHTRDEERAKAAHHAEWLRRVVAFLAWFAGNCGRLLAAAVTDDSRPALRELAQFLKDADAKCKTDTGRALKARWVTYQLVKLRLERDPEALSVFAVLPAPGSEVVRVPRRDRRVVSVLTKLVEPEYRLLQRARDPVIDVAAFGAALTALETAVHRLSVSPGRGPVTELHRRTWAAMLAEDDVALDAIDDEVWAANQAGVRASFAEAEKKLRLQFLRNRLRAGFTGDDSREIAALEGEPLEGELPAFLGGAG